MQQQGEEKLGVVILHPDKRIPKVEGQTERKRGIEGEARGFHRGIGFIFDNFEIFDKFLFIFLFDVL